jgi:hypothetical protein
MIPHAAVLCAGCRASFPGVTLFDNVTCQHRLVTEHLGIDRLKLVVGFSMGAQQAFQWGALYPEMVEAQPPPPTTTTNDPLRRRRVTFPNAGADDRVSISTRRPHFAKEAGCSHLESTTLACRSQISIAASRGTARCSD